jgi:hypothetical protein
MRSHIYQLPLKKVQTSNSYYLEHIARLINLDVRTETDFITVLQLFLEKNDVVIELQVTGLHFVYPFACFKCLKKINPNYQMLRFLVSIVAAYLIFVVQL